MEIVTKIKQLRNMAIAIELPYPCEFDENTTYCISIKKKRSKRSIQQNRYMWELIGQIDKQLNEGRPNDPNRIYCDCLKKAHAKSEYYLCVESGLEMLKQKFRGTQIIGKVDFNNIEYLNVECFLGSSKMDTKEMTDLIDIVLDYASEVGIYTEYWEDLLK